MDEKDEDNSDDGDDDDDGNEHISLYKKNLEKDPEKHTRDLAERKGRIDYYESWTKDNILGMTVEGLYEYSSKLWAMLIWGNKKYVVE